MTKVESLLKSLVELFSYHYHGMMGTNGAEILTSASGVTNGSWRRIVVLNSARFTALASDNWTGNITMGASGTILWTNVEILGDFTQIHLLEGMVIAYKK